MIDAEISKSSILVLGSMGMVGSAICGRLKRSGYGVLSEPMPRVDLRNQTTAHDLLEDLKPDWVFVAAAKVGGIVANSSYPADFIYDNLSIQTNIIHGSYLAGVKNLLFLGSACIYPRLAPQPMREEYLLSGHLEPTNEPYAVAKIAGIVMCQSYNRQYGTNFISLMPTNLYGPNDNFNLSNSHVIPALIRKMHEAKQSHADFVEVWGSGRPTREFLHVDDLADAGVFLMDKYNSGEIVNVGTGLEITIRNLALLIKDVVGFNGEIRFNEDKPDGMPRKVLDVSKMTALGWKPSISLENGLEMTYKWYVDNRDRIRS